MDAFTIAAVDDVHQLGLDRTAGAMLMVESDLGGEAAEHELASAEAACVAAGATSVVRAADAQEADWLRQARRAAHGSLERAGVARMDDVGVPRSRMPEMLDEIERIAARQGCRSASSAMPVTATCTRLHRRPRRSRRRAQRSTPRATRSIAPRWRWVAP